MVSSEEFERELGRRLHAARAGKWMTLRDVEEMCGVSCNSISVVERGKGATIASVLAIAQACDVGYVQDSTQVGKRLLRVRKHRRLTQKQLAEKMGASINTIGCMERGTRSMQAATFYRACVALDVNPWKILEA